MGGPVAIRQAQHDDVSALQLMLERLAAETGRAGEIRGKTDDLLRYGFGERPLFAAFIAFTPREDAGMLLCFPEYSSWRGRPGIYVQDLYVAQRHCGSGIARALLAEAARLCTRSGGCYLRLSTTSENSSAADFYVRIGFAEKADERIFVLEGPPFTTLGMIA